MSKNDILEKCLSDFKTTTGYEYSEIIQDKVKFNNFIDEDNKKDLSEYKKQCKENLESVNKIFSELLI